MDCTGTGAFLMVKVFYLIVFAILTSQSASAQFFARASYFSWQEEVAVEGLTTLELATLSLHGVGVGYEYVYKQRWRYGISTYLLTGDANLHALGSGNSARRNSSAILGEARAIYRFTKTLAMGAIGTLGLTQLSKTSQGINFGTYLAIEYDLSAKSRFTQTLGTVGTSSSLAYSFNLSRSF